MAVAQRRLRNIVRTLRPGIDGADPLEDAELRIASGGTAEIRQRSILELSLPKTEAAAARRAGLLSAALSQDSAVGVRRAAAEAMGCLSFCKMLTPEVADRLACHLAAQLAGELETTVKESICRSLGMLGATAHVAKNAAAVSVALGTELSWSVRAALVTCLGQLRASGEVGQILSAFRSDARPEVRVAAATALGSLGLDSTKGAQETCLLALSNDTDARVRIAAARALSARALAGGGFNSMAVEQLRIALASDEDPAVQVAVAELLGVVGSHSSAATEVVAHTLALRLGADSEAVVVAATVALGKLGHGAAPYAQALLNGLRHPSSSAIRQASQRALWAAVQGDGQALVAEFRRRSGVGRPDVAKSLGRWSVHAAPTVLRCVQAMRSDNPKQRREAEAHLSAIGTAAVPVLAECVIQARTTAGVEFADRMAVMRGLGCAWDLPRDLACSFLAEWIYDPSLSALPIPGLTLFRLQQPNEQKGHHLQWAILRKTSNGHIYLVFRGSETIFDWFENVFAVLRGVELPGGSVLMHSGYWSVAESESKRIEDALAELAVQQPIESLVLCGGSKGIPLMGLAVAGRFLLQLQGSMPADRSDLRHSEPHHLEQHHSDQGDLKPRTGTPAAGGAGEDPQRQLLVRRAADR